MRPVSLSRPSRLVRARPARRLARRLAVAACAVAGTCLFPTATAQSGEPEARISHISGEPVPRFASLRYGEVNGRAGPSEEHPILWQYRRQDLPVLIVKESIDWRRVRDPDGDEVWVHARMLDGTRTGLIRIDTPLRDGPRSDAPVAARLEAGLVVKLGDCLRHWCDVRVEGRRGWAIREAVWGAREE